MKRLVLELVGDDGARASTSVGLPLTLEDEPDGWARDVLLPALRGLWFIVWCLERIGDAQECDREAQWAEWARRTTVALDGERVEVSVGRPWGPEGDPA